MFNNLIKFSLNNRVGVLLFLVGLLLYGAWTINQLPVDVFPDLNRPRVTVIVEAHGLAPEEVETIVTVPIESVLNGTPGVIQLRSSSGIGIAIIYVEFDWGTDIYKNRQLVAERLQLATERLPEGITPVMGPITSIMGEIQFVGMTSPDSSVDPIELRTLADWVVRPRLMSLPGVSQVVVMGGGVKQYHILVSTEKLQVRGISLEALKNSLSKISENTTGGFVNIDQKEYLIRPLGRVESVEDIENTPVGVHLGKPVLVKDIAQVKIAPKIKRGDSSVNAKKSVVMTIQKQPDANTIQLTKKIDAVLQDLKVALPKGVQLEGDLFKQSRFIEASISNVKEALRDGAIMVALILFLFLMNFRTTAITLVAIPVSIVVTAIIFKWLGISINTMTLGGLAVAIGGLVDDAIVGVENVFRRLKENKAKENPEAPLRVVYLASKEILSSIVFATLIVVMVFVPLFALSGIEGKLFAPLGYAYIISILASLFVSVTITPVLCYYLLPNAKAIESEKDSWLVEKLKRFNRSVLDFSIDRPFLVIAVCSVLLIGSLALLPLMGKNFLPKFNEGTATIGVALPPGISLEESDKLGTKMEEAMLSIPEVKSTIRRTGRAEMDEHAEGVHWNEIDVDFHEDSQREKQAVLNELREKLEALGDLQVNVGQPISHRLDHMLSGVRAQMAIKIFGTDLTKLRQIGVQVESILSETKGVVDLQIEPLVKIPQLKISIDREAASQYWISPGELAEDLEIALNGENVASVLEQQRIHGVFMRLDDKSRSTPESIENVSLKTMPNGELVRLIDIADVYKGSGPNMVKRENMQRRLIVSANSSGRDLGTLMDEVRERIKNEVKMPSGYFIEYGGQFKSQERASKLITLLGILAILAIFAILVMEFRSAAVAIQVMTNVPLALIGSIVAIYLTERTLSVATLIAFITLLGISTRNGILMISHYLHLMKEEGEGFTKEMIIRGSLERLVPVLMTTGTAILALSPLVLAKGEAGKEILYPVAVVIIGGLLSSTLLDLIVTPTVFFKFGKGGVDRVLGKNNEQEIKL